MVFKAERPKQAQAQGNNTHSRNAQDNCKHYQEHTSKQQTIAEITRGTSSTNDA
jgi:hypothetical protein